MSELVSLVMPTRNRVRYIPTALRCFHQQTYTNLELIIIDDGDEFGPLESWVEYFTRPIQYLHLGTKHTTGYKRNLGADIARGEIIASLDDDDWSSRYRIEDQVQRLLATGKAVTGYNETVIYDEATEKIFKNIGGPPYYASGTSQCYLKSWWKQHPFLDITVGEDGEFSKAAKREGQLVIAPVGKMMVARKHTNNTCEVMTRNLKKLEASDLDPEFFQAVKDPSYGSDYLFGSALVTIDREEAEKQFKSPVRVPNILDEVVQYPTVEIKPVKILIAIESCHRDRSIQKAQRETWIKDIPARVDYKFFIGRPDTLDLGPDEVGLDVADSYEGLAEKTRAICRWALDHGYEFVYKTDTDTLVSPANLLESGFHKWEYMGGFNADFTPKAFAHLHVQKLKFASGGAGYWLSKHAMEIVANYPRVLVPAEDVFVAGVLAEFNIDAHYDTRYRWRPGEIVDRDVVSLHLSSALQLRYDPDQMYKLYDRMKAIQSG